MASEQAVLDVFTRALWDPSPTEGSDFKARQLAAAMGYPPTFRVVRTVEIDSVINAEGKKEPKCIVDRIYSGKPDSGCDMWYHHEEAMKAAEAWPIDKITFNEEEEEVEQEEEEEPSPHHFQGGHMLPRQPLFSKGDKVQVMYEGNWWDATILKRKQNAADGSYKYQVHYPADGSKQSGIEEELIRPRAEAPDPKKVAKELGFGDGWEVVVHGKNRYKIKSPDGERFTGLKSALAEYKKQLEAAGDPPWRKNGSDYLGRRVTYTVQHKPSSRRTIDVSQRGTVVGWIRDTDVDRAGEPGFISERTGKPASLYHVDFDGDQHHHPYASLMIKSQDFEEYELLEILDEEVAAAPAAAAQSPKKKARIR